MLTVDSREPQEIMPLLAEKLEVERRQLDVGDFCWHDSHEELVLVTRKGSDLVSSVYSDHFQDELERMVQCLESSGGGKAFAIIEGPWNYYGGKLRHYKQAGPQWFRAHREQGGTPNFLEGVWINLILGGIPAIYTSSLVGTAAALTILYNKSQDGWPCTFKRPRRLPPLMRTRDSRVAHLMHLCPRLSEKVAIRLLKRFCSIAVIVDKAQNHPEDLLEVEGFGQGSLKKLLEVIQ